MASNWTPTWYRILRHWDNDGGTGLSFSFLVGATREPIAAKFRDEQEAREYSRDLYDEIGTAEVEGFRVLIHGCQDIRGPVVTLQCGLPRLLRNVPPFDDLWEFYGTAIRAGEFSLTSGHFHAMTEDEKNWVAEAIGQEKRSREPGSGE
jgi:hypothetical protein